MAEINFPLRIEFAACIASASRSLLSLLEVLRSSEAIRNRIIPGFGDFFGPEVEGGGSDFGVDPGDLIFGEPVFGAADGALKLVINPSDRYLDLVAAITRDGDVSSDFDVHGWPILSVIPAGIVSPSIAESSEAAA